MKPVKVSTLIAAGTTIFAGVAVIKWVLMPLMTAAGANDAVIKVAANLAGVAIVLTALVMLIRDSFGKGEKEEQEQ